MSVREEDRERNCSNRGLGIAAAAIGVGVGAALYYLFSKREETPDATASSSSWTCEETLSDIYEQIENASMSTTSDSDMDISTSNFNTSTSSLNTIDSSSTSTDLDMDTEDSEHTSNHSALESSFITISEYSTTDSSIISTDSYNLSPTRLSEVSDFNISIPDVNSSMEYIVNSYVEDFDLPNLNTSGNSTNSFRRNVSRFVDRYVRSVESHNIHSRDRSWAIEECSICFETMQLKQEVLALPCTHRFHQPCILPWLQERHTCPNCRKEA